MLGRWPTPEPLRRPPADDEDFDELAHDGRHPLEPDDEAPVGEWLRATRVRKAFSLGEVSRDTRINQSYLEAIEAGRFEELPAPVYARGFVRSFARYLGLDPELAVARMPDDLPRPAGLDPLPGLRRSSNEGATLPMPSLPPMPAVLHRIDQRWLLGGAGVVLLLLVLLVARTCGGGGTANNDAQGTVPASGGAAGPRASAPAGVPAFEPGHAPNLVGVTREQAESALRDAKLGSVVVEIATADAPAGQVVGQTPAPGAVVKEGDNVTLVVSRGPPR